MLVVVRVKLCCVAMLAGGRYSTLRVRRVQARFRARYGLSYFSQQPPILQPKHNTKHPSRLLYPLEKSVIAVAYSTQYPRT
jgi:hypothetical protein